MTSRALVVVLSLLASAAFASDPSERPAPLGQFHLGADLGLTTSWTSSLHDHQLTADFGLSVGDDLTAKWTVDAVLGAMVGSDGGFVYAGLRPIYRLNDHFDLGASAAYGLTHSPAGIFGLHFGFQAAYFYAAYEPSLIVTTNEANPFDDTAPASKVLLMPLRLSLGVRF